MEIVTDWIRYILTPAFWTRKVFFIEAIAAWMFVAYSCLTWYPPTYLCAATAMLLAQYMISEDD